MRRSPLHFHQWMAFVLMASLLVIGVWTAAPVSHAVAWNATATDAHMHRMERKMRPDCGKVTDGDGFIGNGSWGADRAPARRLHAMRRMTRPVRDMHVAPSGARSHSAPLSTPTALADSVPNGTLDPAQAKDGTASPGVTDEALPQTAQQGDSAAEQSMGRAWPWAIAALAAVAVALVILALVPKKNRSH